MALSEIDVLRSCLCSIGEHQDLGDRTRTDPRSTRGCFFVSQQIRIGENMKMGGSKTP